LDQDDPASEYFGAGFYIGYSRESTHAQPLSGSASSTESSSSMKWLKQFVLAGLCAMMLGVVIAVV